MNIFYHEIVVHRIITKIVCLWPMYALLFMFSLEQLIYHMHDGKAGCVIWSMASHIAKSNFARPLIAGCSRQTFFSFATFSTRICRLQVSVFLSSVLT